MKWSKRIICPAGCQSELRMYLPEVNMVYLAVLETSHAAICQPSFSVFSYLSTKHTYIVIPNLVFVA